AARSFLLEEFRKRIARGAAKHFDKIAADEQFATLMKSTTSRARRVLAVLASTREHDPVQNEIRVPKESMRLAASAILDIRPNSDLNTIAEQLPDLLYTTEGLSTLFDDKVSFSLADRKITIQPSMRYR